MTCEELVALLVDLVEDELDEDTRHALAHHCRLCPDCEGFKNTYEATRALVDHALRRPLPDAARLRIEAELRRRLLAG